MTIYVLDDPLESTSDKTTATSTFGLPLLPEPETMTEIDGISEGYSESSRGGKGLMLAMSPVESVVAKGRRPSLLESIISALSRSSGSAGKP